MSGKLARCALGVALLSFGVALAAAVPRAAPQGPAYFSFGNPFDTPELRNYWNAVAGAGEVYEISPNGGKKYSEEFDILSAESIEGMDAYWLQVSVDSPKPGGKIYVKTLVIPKAYEARKVILQLPGMAAMDVPVAAATGSADADPRKGSKRLGTETITVPGGTFECEHWRESNGTEAWLSSKIGPLTAVKIAEFGKTWLLTKTISHPKDAVTGPVKAFDPDAIKRFTERLNAQH